MFMNVHFVMHFYLYGVRCHIIPKMFNKFLFTVLIILLSACGDVEDKHFFQRYLAGDLSARVSLTEKALKADNSESAFFAGLAYDPGILKTESNADLALSFYTKAAEKYSGAQHNLALLLIKGKSSSNQIMQEAKKYLTKASKQGRIESVMLLASLYEKGWPGIEVNTALSIELYEQAIALTGDPRAMTRAGAAHQDRIAGRSDAEKARMYLESAAKQGIAEAQYRMAYMTYDPSLQATWLYIAAKSDGQYEPSARDALEKISLTARNQAKRNGDLWIYAHMKTSYLVNFTLPVRSP